MAKWFWILLFVSISASARVVKHTDDLLPVIPPGQEDPKATKSPDPIEQADGKVVQTVSWDVAEDFNLARVRAKERREQRMAQQQEMAAKAQAEAEAKVKAAWEKNAHENSIPKAKENMTTVVHLTRRPRAYVKQANHTPNRTQGVKNISSMSNASVARKPDPAMDGLDHMVHVVGDFGQELEKFTKMQAVKGKKLPPQIASIMANAEDLMKKIIAVSDDKSTKVSENKANKESPIVETQPKSTAHLKDERNTSSNQSTSILHATNSSVASKIHVSTGNVSVMIPNASSVKNATGGLQQPNSTIAAAKASTDTTSVSAMANNKNVTQVTNSIQNGTLTASKNATDVTISSSTNATVTSSGKATSARNAGREPKGNATQTASAHGTGASHTKNATVSQTNSSRKKNTEFSPAAPTTFNKPDRLVHSALGVARLAAAKLRGIRRPPSAFHEPVDDSWKLANSEIDSRIVGLNEARNNALKAEDQDLADSLQEKIMGLQAEAAENEAKAKKVKGKHHSAR